MNNLFLTGKIGIGKSTILKKVLEMVDISIGGYITERQIKSYTRSYIVNSLYNNTSNYPIAEIDERDFSKKIFIHSFENGIVKILDESLKNRDLIVLDELGFMENDIDKFTSKVYEILDSKKIVFGVLKDYDCEFLNNIRQRKDLIVIEITEENRDEIIDNIVDILKSFGASFKKF